MTTVTQSQTDKAQDAIQQLVDGCFMTSYKVRGASGEATIPHAETHVNGATIANDKVGGTKIQWFPKGEIKIKGRYTAKLQRLFNEFGVRWGEQYIIPKSRLDEFKQRLDDATADFEDDKADFIANFDTILDKYISDNPDIADLINAHKLSRDDFAARFKLEKRPPLVICTLDPDDQKDMVSTIAESIWDEIESDANTIYKNSWFNKGIPVHYVTQAIRHPLERMRKKLESLSNIEPKLTSVCFTIVEVFEKLPVSGKISGHDFQQLTNWMHVLGDRDKLMMHASGDQVFEYQPRVPVATSQPQTPAPVSQDVPVSTSEPVQSVESNTANFDPSSEPAPVVEHQNLGFEFGTGFGW
jgi:hypothetical protein